MDFWKLKDFFDRCLNWIGGNIFLVFVFLSALVFFILQHYWVVGWDFSAYVINARFLFGSGDYIEVLRAPLSSFILGLTLIFGKLGEYIYLVIVLGLFLWGNVSLSNALYEKYFYKYNLTIEQFRFIFFVLSLSPFAIRYGLLEGTELLGLAFFELFLANWILNKNSGHYLGLAALSRYNFVIFGVMFLINKSWRKIGKNIFLFVLPFVPWLIYNRVKWGNFLMSMIDSYNHNIILREELMRAFNFYDLLSTVNILAPLLLLGVIYAVYKIVKKKDKALLWFTVLFSFIAAVVVWDYSGTPFKIARYLFNLTLPLAYFSALGVVPLFEKIKNKKNVFFAIIVVWILIFGVIGYDFYSNREYKKTYEKAGNAIIENNLTSCYVASHHWVQVNYYTGNVYYLWMKPNEVVERGGVALIFPDYPTLDDTFNETDLEGLPIIDMGDKYVLFGKENLTSRNCKKRFSYSRPVTNNPCSVVSSELSHLGLDRVTRRVCLVFNER